MHVPEAVLVGGQLDAHTGGPGVQLADLRRGQGGRLCPDLLVPRVGEGVLHVQLEVVVLQAAQEIDERPQLVHRGHAVPGDVEHVAPALEGWRILDATAGHATALGQAEELGDRRSGGEQELLGGGDPDPAGSDLDAHAREVRVHRDANEGLGRTAGFEGEPRQESLQGLLPGQRRTDGQRPIRVEREDLRMLDQRPGAGEQAFEPRTHGAILAVRPC